MRRIKGILYGKESVTVEGFSGGATRSQGSSCEQCSLLEDNASCSWEYFGLAVVGI